MRLFSTFLLTLSVAFSFVWETDIDTAKQKAKQEHKYILLNFSGSDWCVPCIRMRKEVFDSDTFNSFAAGNLVLVNADFPRLKKNQLSKEQEKKNEKLADKYNSKGSFPFTVLLNEEGEVLKTWEGYPGLTPDQFTGQIKAVLNARQ